MKKKVKQIKQVASRDELLELVDELFIYFDLTEDSYSEPPYIALHDGMRFTQGLVDPELHDILMRMYDLINQDEE